MFLASKYDLWPDLKDTPYGPAAKIAVCKSFRSAGKAYKDGCHAAIVTTPLTRLWHRLAKRAASEAFKQERSMALGNNKEAQKHEFVRDALCSIIAVTQILSLWNAGFFMRIDTDERVPDAPNFKVHQDRIGRVLGVFGTEPHTIVLPFLPKMNTKKGYVSIDGNSVLHPDTIKHDDFKGLPSFSTPPDSYLMFFEIGGESTLPHSAPYVADPAGMIRGFHYARN